MMKLRLRTLMLAMFIMCVILAVWGARERNRMHLDRIRSRIGHLHGEAISRDQHRQWRSLNDIERLYLTGDLYWAEVAPGVANDDDMKWVGELTHLKELDISDTNVSNRGISALAELRDIHSMRLAYTNVSDTGIESVARAHPTLTYLSIDGLEVAERGLTAIGELPALSHFHASESSISDKTVERICDARELKGLYLSKTHVGDLGAKYLACFKKLEALDLSSTRISDTGVKHLESLSRLRDLDLSCCELTDASVPALSKLRHLESLDITYTNITEGGAEELSCRLGLPLVSFAAMPAIDKPGGILHDAIPIPVADVEEHNPTRIQEERRRQLYSMHNFIR